MKISVAAWTKYKDRLSKIDQRAIDEMTEFLRQIHGWEGHEPQVLAFAYGLSTKYGEAAAAAACEMYDTCARASGRRVPKAEPAPTATYNETAKAVRGTVKNRSESQIPNTVGRLVKQAGADTTLRNVARDGAQFAWVPSGDTCPFCIMLASNGWQYISKSTLKRGHAEHIHANCDCQYAVRFSEQDGVAGYDPDRYREIYDNADGNTWQEKLRSMQHDQYEAHKDERNARRRELYAEKHNKLIVTNTAQKVINPSYGYKDVTKEWLSTATPNTHRVGKVTTFIQDGKTYTVDGINVQFNPGEEEKKVASILSRTLGGEILLMPTVRGIYSNVRTPDFLFHGERLELKTPRNYSKSVLFRSIRGNHEQAENFVIDITACKMTEAEIRRQVEKVYLDPFTSFVKNLIIIKDDGVYAIFERKK